MDIPLPTQLAVTQPANTVAWVLTGLQPAPEEAWERLRGFSGPTAADRQAMLQTVEILFRRGPELVAENYDYLLHNQETAAILGWEKGADEAHLAERRRFFTVWLARTLSLDLGNDFAGYLFRAGQIHAGHGPRRIHVPEVYVTGAISLVNSAFARFLQQELPNDPVVPAALAGWNKYLAMHLHMMLSGYRTAVELDRGDFMVPIHFLGGCASCWQSSNWRWAAASSRRSLLRCASCSIITPNCARRFSTRPGRPASGWMPPALPG